MNKQITIPDIGIVLISKKRNAKRIKLRVHPEKGVLVTIPYYSSFKEAEKFVFKNIDWLKERTSIQKDKNISNIFTPESIFLTRKSTISFVVDERVVLYAESKENHLHFSYNPLRIDLNTPRAQDFIKKGILDLLKIEGYTSLVQKIEKLSKLYNLRYECVKIGTAGTRWGSCNSINEITLSCRLLLLPDFLIDYIITHELCHLVHKNHSQDFHTMLDKLSNGKSKELNLELKKHSIQIRPGDYRY